MKKHREVGRLGWNPDSEEVCLKIQGGREARLFAGSYLQILEKKKKNAGR